jgi:hypothetical protein
VIGASIAGRHKLHPCLIPVDDLHAKEREKKFCEANFLQPNTRNNDSEHRTDTDICALRGGARHSCSHQEVEILCKAMQ